MILDAKRGDIGDTAEQYAREAFERYRADALTLSPFMGFDSIEPYLRYAGKGLFLLCRTSNPGGGDLQAQRLANPASCSYEHIARLAAGAWNRSGQLGLVVGATFPDEIARVRELAPTLPLLIPGVGAQGGDAAATVRAGWRHGDARRSSSTRRARCSTRRRGRRLRRGRARVALATRDMLNAARAREGRPPPERLRHRAAYHGAPSRSASATPTAAGARHRSTSLAA